MRFMRMRYGMRDAGPVLNVLHIQLYTVTFAATL